jgi:hypothetical protein
MVLVNPGGPGGAGTRLPLHLSGSTVGGIGTNHDLIGFGPRGIGYSASISCAARPDDGAEPDDSLPEEAKARAGFERDGKRNRRCAEAGPEFVRNPTTADIARDMDRAPQPPQQRRPVHMGLPDRTCAGLADRIGTAAERAPSSRVCAATGGPPTRNPQ